MATKPNRDRTGQSNHALRKLIGTVVIAGATYAVEKIIASKKSKKPKV